MHARFEWLLRERVAGVIALVVACTLPACAIGPGQAPPSQRQASTSPAPHSYDPARPFAKGDRAAPVSVMQETRQPEPGLEQGFIHCCGDVDYAMQVDCSDRLMRCYENDLSGWQQTYGRSCKEALGQGCYEQGCLSVCDGP